MNYVITIGRQLGSGGKALGSVLAERLHIRCYDKELIQLASRESGVRSEFFEGADERRRAGFFSHLFGTRSGVVSTSDNILSGEQLFQIQSDVIRSIAQRESCIFVGRCADYILRDAARLLSVFICANADSRIANLVRDGAISPREAAQRMAATDRKRAEYYNFYTDKQWGVATSYDLCVNASLFSVEEIADIIVGKVEARGWLKN